MKGLYTLMDIDSSTADSSMTECYDERLVYFDGHETLQQPTVV